MNSDVLNACFRRLVPHLDTARVALTGGVAIGLHLGVTRRDRIRCPIAGDVDFVADDADVVRPTVTTDFLVSHFHLPQPGYPKFLIQLVDPGTRLRLDFFPDSLRALKRARVAAIAGVQLRVLEAQDISTTNSLYWPERLPRTRSKKSTMRMPSVSDHSAGARCRCCRPHTSAPPCIRETPTRYAIDAKSAGAPVFLWRRSERSSIYSDTSDCARRLTVRTQTEHLARWSGHGASPLRRRCLTPTCDHPNQVRAAGCRVWHRCISPPRTPRRR